MKFIDDRGRMFDNQQDYLKSQLKIAWENVVIGFKELFIKKPDKNEEIVSEKVPDIPVPEIESPVDDSNTPDPDDSNTPDPTTSTQSTLIPETNFGTIGDSMTLEEYKSITTSASTDRPVETIAYNGTLDDKSYSKIEIDYAHECIKLLDENGRTVASTPIDADLVRNTIDADLADAIFGDKPIPESISTNIESIPTTNEQIQSGIDSNNPPSTPVG